MFVLGGLSEKWMTQVGIGKFALPPVAFSIEVRSRISGN